MRTVIVYATTEGQTRKIARFAAERVMERGQEVEIIDAVECPPDFSLDPYGLAILMASLHMGHYQPAIVDFIRRYREDLEAIENAFVSVSLSAASSDSDDLEGLEELRPRVLRADRLDAQALCIMRPAPSASPSTTSSAAGP